MSEDPEPFYRKEYELDELGTIARRAVYGDGVGLALFLGTILFVGLYWRLGFFSSDNYAIANTLVAVAEGHLHLQAFPYGPDSGVMPGTYAHGGRVYGRNYGMVAAALPILYLLRVAVVLVDLRILLVGGYALTLLAWIVTVGTLLDRNRLGRIAGAGIAGGFFVVNVALANPLDPNWLPLIALQVVSITAAALIAVLVYRLARDLYGRRVGLAAGVLAGVASPVGFWASVPKRHSVTAMLAVL
ncbi:MAG TPA: hypothetical protein VJ898_01710, partial [Natrialbaceae archaeon]|nr:hypothetical protein [Natrialbaceae archaeon]